MRGFNFFALLPIQINGHRHIADDQCRQTQQGGRLPRRSQKPPERKSAGATIRLVNMAIQFRGTPLAQSWPFIGQILELCRKGSNK